MSLKMIADFLKNAPMLLWR